MIKAKYNFKNIWIKKIDRIGLFKIMSIFVQHND